MNENNTKRESCLVNRKLMCSRNDFDPGDALTTMLLTNTLRFLLTILCVDCCQLSNIDKTEMPANLTGIYT